MSICVQVVPIVGYISCGGIVKCPKRSWTPQPLLSRRV